MLVGQFLLEALEENVSLPFWLLEATLACGLYTNLKEVYSSRPNLPDRPDIEMFTHGSNFMDWGLWKTEQAAVSHQEVEVLE